MPPLYAICQCQYTSASWLEPLFCFSTKPLDLALSALTTLVYAYIQHLYDVLVRWFVTTSCVNSVFFETANYFCLLVGLKSYLFLLHAGVSYNFEKTENGIFRLKLTANATKTIADLRRPLEILMKGKTINHPDLTLSAVQLLLSRDGVAHLKSIEQETGTYIMYDRQSLNIKVFGHQDQMAAAEVKLVHALRQLLEKKPLEIYLRGHNLPPDLMKKTVENFGVDLEGFNKEMPEIKVELHQHRHLLKVWGSKEDKRRVERMISELASFKHSSLVQLASENVGGKEDDQRVDYDEPSEDACPICLCEIEDPFRLESCGHMFCLACLICTKCHFEYHPFISCEAYKEYKEDPDSTLLEWRKGKANVKSCPSCGYTIEKSDGCNHVECRLIRWITEFFLVMLTGLDRIIGPFSLETMDQTYHQRTCLLKRVAADFLNEGVGLVVELWEADMNASSTETRRQGYKLMDKNNVCGIDVFSPWNYRQGCSLFLTQRW
ncbi:unnamed protein product [Triticum turgidum subsp. durum]|uniref:RING-type domain-containing protein n=1 Tax=Triticum turgidum subsp. durum TaxID=4567 RepID=A0A9R1NMY5_TRITD|nr:unnamed protein product [Triticum turgidum subsp. durum]